MHGHGIALFKVPAGISTGGIGIHGCLNEQRGPGNDLHGGDAAESS